MGEAAEGAGVVSAFRERILARDALERAIREHDDALRAERQAEQEAQFLEAHVSRLSTLLGQSEAITTGAALSAVIAAIALLLVLALPAHAEPPRLIDARTAQTSCVLRAYRTRTASAGVSVREAALVSRLGAEHACALEGWARALGAAAEVRVVTATRAPVVCEPAPAAALACPEDRPTWIDLLSHGGACALCGGGVALGAWASCGGAR